MGKRKGESDEDLKVAPEGDPARGLAGAQLDPGRSRQLVTTRRTDKQTRRDESIDPAQIARAAATAYESGAASTRVSFDSIFAAQAKALDAANGRIDKLSTQNDELRTKLDEKVAELLKLGTQSKEASEREHEARIAELKIVQTHATIRHVADRAGPGVGPAVKLLLSKFAPELTEGMPESGEKSPRAAVARLVGYLQNGSEPSLHVLGLLEEMAGPEDWPLVLAFLAQAAQADQAAKPAEAAAGVH